MQEHEARSRTRGDRLGVTDTPVCERFHGQRLWSPYTGVKYPHDYDIVHQDRQYVVPPL